MVNFLNWVHPTYGNLQKFTKGWVTFLYPAHEFDGLDGSFRWVTHWKPYLGSLMGGINSTKGINSLFPTQRITIPQIIESQIKSPQGELNHKLFTPTFHECSTSPTIWRLHFGSESLASDSSACGFGLCRQNIGPRSIQSIPMRICKILEVLR